MHPKHGGENCREMTACPTDRITTSRGILVVWRKSTRHRKKLMKIFFFWEAKQHKSSKMKAERLLDYLGIDTKVGEGVFKLKDNVDTKKW